MTQAAVLSSCAFLKETPMHNRLGLIAAVGITLLLDAALCGCSANAQPTQITGASAIATSYATMPEPRAPFDETPITPVESAGASMMIR